MDPDVILLLQQIAIALAALAAGIIIGTIASRPRLRRARYELRQRVDELESELALRRFRIRELEAWLDGTGGEGAVPPAVRVRELPPQPTTWSGWLAGSAERAPDSPSSRV